MEIGLIVGVVIAVAVILIIGGGLAYFFWVSSRPKKMTWNAQIYQKGDGIIDGKLSELKPFARDVIEKIDKKSGATHYWLQKMKKAVPVVTADCVEVWENGQKHVKVLLDGDTMTLIKSGYDTKTAQEIFKPMPHDRINMIKTEIEERKARIENTKDILAQITPFVVVGIAMLGLVAIVYFQVQGAIKVGELNSMAQKDLNSQIGAFRSEVLKSRGCILESEDKQVKQEDPPNIPP